MTELSWWLYLLAAVLLALAAFNINGKLVSLAVLAAAILVFTYFVLPSPQ